jgi:putative membrane protein
MTSRATPRVAVAAIALVALCAAAPAWAQNQPPTGPAERAASALSQPLNQQDRDFLNQAAMGGSGEVAMGRIAETQAAGPAVREFGRWMVTDHSAINEALERLSHRMGATLASGMDPQDQAMLEKLKGLHGRAFDAQYIPDQVQGHEKTIALFEREEREGAQPVLKTLAHNTLVMLHEHLTEAQELAQLPEVAGRHRNVGAGSTMPRRHETQ